VAQLIRRDEIDWDIVQRSATRGGWRRILSLALAVVRRVYGPPEGIRFEADRELLKLAERLESYLRNARNHSYLEWHRDMLRARDNPISRVRQVCNFFF